MDASGSGHGQPHNKHPGEQPDRTDWSAGILQSHFPPEEEKRQPQGGTETVKPPSLPLLFLNELMPVWAICLLSGARLSQGLILLPQRKERNGTKKSVTTTTWSTYLSF